MFLGLFIVWKAGHHAASCCAKPGIQSYVHLLQLCLE